MNHTQFKKYDLEDQLVLTLKRGTLLMECLQYNVMLRLFAFENFYVEVTSNEDSKEVMTVTAYESVSHMDHILSQIDISDIHLT
jgi:hypothetical protein